jgi:hypothetical protein
VRGPLNKMLQAILILLYCLRARFTRSGQLDSGDL